MDSILISAAAVATIITVTQVIKKVFEFKWLAFVLNLIKCGFIIPYIPVILSVVVGALVGLTTYGMDGLTANEIIQIIIEIISANGAFMLVAKASGVEPKVK